MFIMINMYMSYQLSTDHFVTVIIHVTCAPSHLMIQLRKPTTHPHSKKK